MIKHKNQRVAVLMDAQNLYHSAKNLYNSKVNFKNILDVAVSDRQLVKAIAYVITTESGEESNFFEALTKIGIEIKTKDLQIFYGGNKKGDWDVGLAVDAIKIANKVDSLIIVSGDGDFVPLLEYLKNVSNVEIVSFGKSTSHKLKEVADDFIDLCENVNKYIITHKNSRNNREKKFFKKSKPKLIPKIVQKIV